MRIGLLTAIWGRPRVTELVLDYYDTIKGDLCIAIVSDEDPDPLEEYETTNFEVFAYPNKPLSNKWNYGMSMMKDWKPDAVIIVGSDDLITPKYIEACRYFLKHGAEYICLEGAYFFDAIKQRMCYGKARRLGLGRCLSRSLLERVDWNPWPNGLNSGLDGAMDEVLAPHYPRIVRIEDPVELGLVGLDIKTGENIWGYDSIRDNLVVQDVDPEPVLREHFPTVADHLLQWNQS